MRSKLLLILSLLAILGGAVSAVLSCMPAVYASLAVALLAVILFYRSVAKPLHTIRIGMDLLRSQDFASRLAHVGQADADSMVDLYNSIIANLKEERLRNYEQECFLSKIIEASPTGIALCDFEGKIVRHNRAFSDFSSPALLEALSTLPEDGTCVLRPGGMQVLRCSHLYFMDRGFHRSFYLVERLTDEIVRAETAMFHKVVRTMGHEVNNTLGGVISVLQSLADIHAADPDVAAAIGSCCKSCEGLGDFVRAYSDIVKLPDAEPELVDLNVFVASTLPFLQGMCPTNVTLQSVAADLPVMVSADIMLLQRVLVNAVKNACESIGDAPGTVTIQTAPAQLVIADNGPGIAPDDADRIFSPFFSTKRADRGLGLMLISDILRKHRADFTLATHPDGITRLTVTFPSPL